MHLVTRIGERKASNRIRSSMSISRKHFLQMTTTTPFRLILDIINPHTPTVSLVKEHVYQDPVAAQ
jgi:hypothetical protein